MEKINALICAIFIAGCTTVGQQVTNRDGIVQLKQQNTSVVAANNSQDVKTNSITPLKNNSQTYIKTVTRTTNSCVVPGQIVILK